MKKFLNSFKTRSFRVGGYSVVATLAVVLIIVLVNVGVAVLPDSWTKYDLTTNGVYEISDQSRNIVRGLDMDVNVYWIVPAGSEDVTIDNFLKRYQSLSPRMHLEKIDPNENPGFATKYDLSNVSDNSILVESEKRFRYIPHSQIFKSTYVMDENSESGMSIQVTFEGDAVVTSAVSFVVNDALPIAYRLTGHGESSLDSSYKTKVELDNIKLEDLSLAAAGSVPEDCDLLIILNPTTDLPDDELTLIREFVDRGGNLLLITAPTSKEGVRDNFHKLMEGYGMTEEKGMVVDPNSGNYRASNNALWLLPTLNVHSITQPLRAAGYRPLFVASAGLRVAEEKPEGIKDLRELLVTSDQAFAQITIDLNHLIKKDGDVDGPFCLGALAVKENANGSESTVVWYSSVSILDSAASAFVSGANENLFLNTVDFLTDLEENIGIHGKTITSDYLTVPAGAKNLWMVILIGVIPAIFIIAGIIVTVRRKVR